MLRLRKLKKTLTKPNLKRLEDELGKLKNCIDPEKLVLILRNYGDDLKAAGGMLLLDICRWQEFSGIRFPSNWHVPSVAHVPIENAIPGVIGTKLVDHSLLKKDYIHRHRFRIGMYHCSPYRILLCFMCLVVILSWKSSIADLSGSQSNPIKCVYNALLKFDTPQMCKKVVVLDGGLSEWTLHPDGPSTPSRREPPKNVTWALPKPAANGISPWHPLPPIDQPSHKAAENLAQQNEAAKTASDLIKRGEEVMELTVTNTDSLSLGQIELQDEMEHKFGPQRTQQRLEQSHIQQYKTIKSANDRLMDEIKILKSEEAIKAHTIKALTDNITAERANTYISNYRIKDLETKVSNQKSEIIKLQKFRDQEKQDFRKLKVEYENINCLNSVKNDELEDIAMVNARLLHEIEVFTQTVATWRPASAQARLSDECSVCYEPVR